MVVKTSIDINLNEHAHIRLCTRGGNLLHSRASAIISRCETFIELKCTNNCTEPLFFLQNDDSLANYCTEALSYLIIVIFFTLTQFL